jgi:hypothetical protein
MGLSVAVPHLTRRARPVAMPGSSGNRALLQAAGVKTSDR